MATILQAASIGGNLNFIQFLIKCDVDVNIKVSNIQLKGYSLSGPYGTALQAAAASYKERNLAIVKFLVEHGADVNIQGEKCLISN